MITYTNNDGSVYVLCDESGDLVEVHQVVYVLGAAMRVSSLTPPSIGAGGVYVHGRTAQDPEPRYYLVKPEQMGFQWREL